MAAHLVLHLEFLRLLARELCRARLLCVEMVETRLA